MLKPGSVLVSDFQQRVLLGVSMFVGMLLLVGWVAVNEPGRMEAFTNQYQGRSIEAGAAIFVNNCATCHGQDGKGINGRAPALNNPMLFLKDNPAKAAGTKLADLQKQQTDLQNQITTYNQNVQALAAANDKLKTAQAGSDEAKQLQQQIDTLNGQIKAFDQARAQKQIDDLTPQVQAAQADVDKFTAQGWDPARDTRLNEVKWTGRLEDYIASTVISGRPVSALYWPAAMPAWGQQAGGPMRPDEIRDVTAYIMNFHDTAITLTPKDINQEFKVPGAGATTGPKINASGKAVGANADAKAIAADIKGGDAAAGEQKYTSLGCAGCHVAGQIAPATKGTFTRVTNTRLKDSANAGKTPEEYLVESITHPNAYVVPGFQPGVMPQTFGDQLDVQDLKDLIAYLETQK